MRRRAHTPKPTATAMTSPTSTRSPPMHPHRPRNTSRRRSRAPRRSPMSDIEMGDDGTEEGQFDLSALLQQAQAMQEQVMAAQASAAEQVVEGHAGGGLVKVTVTGGMEFKAVHIDPKAVDPNDVEMLEDLVLAALHDAVHQANQINSQAFGDLGLPGLPGLTD